MGARAELPASAVAPLAPAAQERLTLPGEPLRSRTKIWLGAMLLAATAAVLWSWPEHERAHAPARSEETAAGEAALAEGLRLLAREEHANSALALERAHQLLGDRPELLRALGEAWLRGGRPKEGAAALRRYLALSPGAPDRAGVQVLLERAVAAEPGGARR